MQKMQDADMVVLPHADILLFLRDGNAEMKRDWVGLLAAVLVFAAAVASVYCFVVDVQRLN